jgi:hypothetical protein
MASKTRPGYPALAAWREARRVGVTYPCNHPLSLAACHEATARELDAMADAASNALARRTWRAAADAEVAAAVRILADAELLIRDATGGRRA